MNRTNEGGPAFPRIEEMSEGDFGRKGFYGPPGMSTRTWLVGQILGGAVREDGHPAHTVERAIRMADEAIRQLGLPG